MKKALPAAFISALLISTLAGTLLVNSATANFAPPPGGGGPFGVSVTVTSPENKTYPDGNVPLSFTVNLTYNKKYYVFQNLGTFTYSLNGEQTNFSPSQTRSGDTIYCSTTLKGIPEGSYNLAILVQTNFYYTWWGWPVTWYGLSKITSFAIGGAPPSITVLSTQDETYDTGNVPLNFVISESASWVGYSLDGKTNVSITESTSQPTYSYGSYNYHVVLTGLAEGPHTLTLYANDTAGNTGKSETIQFTVAQETQTQQNKPESQSSTPFPTLWIVAAVVMVAVVGAGLMVFFRKRGRGGAS